MLKKFLLVVVAVLGAAFVYVAPVEASHCFGPFPQGKGDLPVEFMLDGVPRADVRFILLETSAPDVVTGPDGRAVFRDIPYGCYSIRVQFHNGWFLDTTSIGAHYLLLPEGIYLPWGKAERILIVKETTRYGIDTWYNPEVEYDLRSVPGLLPLDCSGPFPEGKGDIRARFFFQDKAGRIEPKNQVRVSLLDTTYLDRITGFNELGEAGWVTFAGIPYGCYKLKFQYATLSGRLDHVVVRVTLMPSRLYEWDGQTDYVRMYVPKH